MFTTAEQKNVCIDLGSPDYWVVVRTNFYGAADEGAHGVKYVRLQS